VSAGAPPDPSPREPGGAAAAGDGEGLAALSSRLGVEVPRDLLLRALTHPSYAHEHPPMPHNETLAFLGDAVLNLAVAEFLVRQDPGAPPGPLTVKRASAVSMRALAAWARELGVGGCLRLGRGEEQHAGREKDSVLATALEAVFAALYLAGGLAAVLPVVAGLMRLERDPASER
jgi:ribonuclease-3